MKNKLFLLLISLLFTLHQATASETAVSRQPVYETNRYLSNGQTVLRPKSNVKPSLLTLDIPEMSRQSLLFVFLGIAVVYFMQFAFFALFALLLSISFFITALVFSRRVLRRIKGEEKKFKEERKIAILSFILSLLGLIAYPAILFVGIIFFWTTP